jgi:hypothetical protein
MVSTDTSIHAENQNLGLGQSFLYCIFILTYLNYLITINIIVIKYVSRTEKAFFHLFNVPLITML